MKSLYFDTPTVAVATNYKAGSATLARAIIAAFHPSLESLITTPHGDGNGTAYPAGKGPDTSRWHGLCPKVLPDARPVTLLAVREPVDHFRSACAESSVADVDAKLTELETVGQGRDAHFWPQSRLLQGNAVKLYRFPQDLDALAVAAGLSLPLPDIDGGHNRPKPTLTDEQEARVLALYSDDVSLYESITEAGQVVAGLLAPKPPLPVPVAIGPAQLRIALRRLHGIEAATVDATIAAVIASIPDPDARAEAQIYATAATSYLRHHPLVGAIAAALGLDPTETDEVFRLGATL